MSDVWAICCYESKTGEVGVVSLEQTKDEAEKSLRRFQTADFSTLEPERLEYIPDVFKTLDPNSVFWAMPAEAIGKL